MILFHIYVVIKWLKNSNEINYRVKARRGEVIYSANRQHGQPHAFVNAFYVHINVPPTSQLINFRCTLCVTDRTSDCKEQR